MREGAADPELEFIPSFTPISFIHFLSSDLASNRTIIPSHHGLGEYTASYQQYHRRSIRRGRPGPRETGVRMFWFRCRDDWQDVDLRGHFSCLPSFQLVFVAILLDGLDYAEKGW